MADFTGFPMCRDGDVLITLTTNRQLQLHSGILKRHSQFFNDHLLEGNAIDLSATAKKSGVTTRWRFDLQHTPGMPGCGRMEQVELNSAGCPISDNTADSYFSAGKVPDPLFDFYEKVFGAIYSRPFEAENEGMGQLLYEVMGLLDIGEYLGCMHVLCRTVDSMLAEHGQDLFKSIATNPMEWGKLAVRIRSFTIIREAIIHLTGQWKAVTQEQKNSMDPKFRILIENKDKLLDQLKKNIETRLANWYPSDLQRRTAEVTPSEHGRSDYASHIIDWMALHIWRQWFCHALINGWLRAGPDGGLTCYKMIADGGPAYLTKENLNDWHTNFEMSNRSKNNLAICLDRIKSKVKAVVLPLLKNESALNIADHPVKYFTCTMFEKRDTLMLWEENPLEWDQPAMASCGPDYSHMISPQLTRLRSAASYEIPKLSKKTRGAASELATSKPTTPQNLPKATKKIKANTPKSTSTKRAAEQEPPKRNKKPKIPEVGVSETATEQDMPQSNERTGSSEEIDQNHEDDG